MNNEISLRLQKQRKLNNYSQEELADKIGVSRQAVSKWERGKSSPDTDNLIALAKLYGITIDELINSNPIKANTDSENIFNSINENTPTSDKTELPYDTDNKMAEISRNQEKYWWLAFPIAIVSAIAMILWGMFKDAWAISWVCFLAVPFIPTLIGAIKHKNPYLFIVALPVYAAYCLLGYYENLWHPAWIIFLIIPLYYTVVVFFKNVRKKP